MKIVFAAIVVLITAPAFAWPIHAQTHDADFPDQMRAINHCYVEFIKSGRTPASDTDLRTCVEEQGFAFCPDCKIFRYSGGACSKDKENGVHRATCWRPAK